MIAAIGGMNGIIAPLKPEQAETLRLKQVRPERRSLFLA